MTTTTPQLPTKQTALEFHAGPDPLSSLRINHGAPLPTFPKSGSNTLVHVHYASPNPIDYKLAAVFWPVPRLVFGSGPIIPGTSFAGTVVQTTVPDLKAGDLVWGKHDVPKKFGGSAEYTVTGGVDGAIKVPDAAGKDLLDEFAGAGVVAITALQMLWASNLPYSRAYKASGGQATVQATGGTVFINGGSGGVGTFAVQMAKHCFGCEKVVASCSGANVDLVKSLGADEVVDYRSCGPGGVSGWLKDWSKRNGGQMFDVVLDNVGSDELYWQCHNYLKAEGGKYVQVCCPILVVFKCCILTTQVRWWIVSRRLRFTRQENDMA